MQVMEKSETIEDKVIAQLKSYNTIVGRMKVLEKYPIGNGMYLTEPFDEDDKLQPLHRQLRKMPSHMYLTPREQKLEEVANMYLPEAPTGIKSQVILVEHTSLLDERDQLLMRELARKVRKVAEARGGTPDAFEEALERVTELQDLQQQKEQIDFVLMTMGEYRKEYSDLLRLLYIQGKTTEEASRELSMHRTNLNKRRKKAIKEYALLAGIH